VEDGSHAPLRGRVAIVTGVSRRRGIGFAIARRLLADGAHVLVQSWAAHDADQPWGADPDGFEALATELGGDRSDRVVHLEIDLADPAAPEQVVRAAHERFGVVDILVANHARSSTQDLEHVTAAELDASFAVNTRATVLLAQAFAAVHDDGRRGGRVILFTSGQHLGAMPGELPYVVSKGAIHQVTRSLADHLAGRGITANAINPGPTDTGWATGELFEEVRARFPDGRWSTPDDVAGVVAFLAGDDSARLTGQVLDVEGGFRR
jgi:3-oxoacyl-[acyl-carrier protein] reductase